MFVMLYINENWFLYSPKVLNKLKLKFWRSFNQKNIYLLRKVQSVLNIKTLNSQKKKLLHKMWKYFVRKNQSTQSFKEK